jgi:thioredoxin-related protein
MRTLFFFLPLIFFFKSGFSQADTSLIYLRFPTAPPFKIMKVPDSTSFTKDDLGKKKATLFMIFSPDCDHCQHETKELLYHIGLFKKVQIIMSSHLSYSEIKKFYEEYKIADYPNITMGWDPGYFLGTFFHIRSFPALFLYDKKGNFVKAFDGSVPISEIAETL